MANHNILIVEDEAITRKEIEYFVNNQFPENNVITTKNTTQALEAIKQYPPYLALVDIRLDDKDDGFSLVENILQKKPDSRIIFITCHTDQEYISKMSEYNPEAIVTKPYSLVQLQASLAKSFSFRARTNRPFDLTENSDKIETLKSKVSFYEHILDSIALISITDEKGNIIYSNRLFQETAGFTEQELYGKNHRIINSGFHPASFWKELYQTVMERKVWSGMVRNKSKNGSYYWVKSYVAGHFDIKGNLMNYFSLRLDVTNDKERIEYLEMRDNYLKNVMSENFINSFVAGIAHNLNNIISTAPYHFEKTFDALNVNKYEDSVTSLQKLENTCERLTKFVSDLTLFTDRLDTDAESESNAILSSFVIDALFFIKSSIPKVDIDEIIKVSFIGDKNVIFKTNKVNLTKALYNVINNCIEFNKDNNQLKIDFTVTSLKRRIIFCIKDNGPGFSQEALQSAFFPFFSTKKSAYNVGAGLSETRKIIRSMNGYIYIENSSEGGAMVTIEINRQE